MSTSVSNHWRLSPFYSDILLEFRAYIHLDLWESVSPLIFHQLYWYLLGSYLTCWKNDLNYTTASRYSLIFSSFVINLSPEGKTLSTSSSYSWGLHFHSKQVNREIHITLETNSMDISQLQNGWQGLFPKLLNYILKYQYSL